MREHHEARVLGLTLRVGGEPGELFVADRGSRVTDVVEHDEVHASVIDGYIWPTAQADSAMRTLSQRGFNHVQWARGGMRFWLVSDLNRDELVTFAHALAQADAARGSGPSPFILGIDATVGRAVNRSFGAKPIM